MASKIQNIGLLLIILGALLSISSHFFGWNNSNLVNLGSLAMVIAGLIAYRVAGKRLLQEK